MKFGADRALELLSDGGHELTHFWEDDRWEVWFGETLVGRVRKDVAEKWLKDGRLRQVESDRANRFKVYHLRKGKGVDTKKCPKCGELRTFEAGYKAKCLDRCHYSKVKANPPVAIGASGEWECPQCGYVSETSSRSCSQCSYSLPSHVQPGPSPSPEEMTVAETLMEYIGDLELMPLAERPKLLADYMAAKGIKSSPAVRALMADHGYGDAVKYLPNGPPASFWSGDLQAETMKNTDYRCVLTTTAKLQLVVMNIPPKGEIKSEVHDADQFVRVESGQANVSFRNYGQDVARFIGPGQAFIVPAGTFHGIRNAGSSPLLLYTIYSPPHHPVGTVHHTKEEEET